MAFEIEVVAGKEGTLNEAFGVPNERVDRFHEIMQQAGSGSIDIPDLMNTLLKECETQSEAYLALFFLGKEVGMTQGYEFAKQQIFDNLMPAAQSGQVITE